MVRCGLGLLEGAADGGAHGWRLCEERVRHGGGGGGLVYDDGIGSDGRLRLFLGSGAEFTE